MTFISSQVGNSVPRLRKDITNCCCHRWVGQPYTYDKCCGDWTDGNA